MDAAIGKGLQDSKKEDYNGKMGHANEAIGAGHFFGGNFGPNPTVTRFISIQQSTQRRREGDHQCLCSIYLNQNIKFNVAMARNQTYMNKSGVLNVLINNNSLSFKRQ